MSDTVEMAYADEKSTEAIGELDFSFDTPKQFSPEQLEKLTAGFSTNLGSGSFGDVFKGVLHNGVQVAVKVFKAFILSNTIKDQFKAEVSVLGKTHHKNVVKLYGFCSRQDMYALVYEFMENGSLEEQLYGSQSIAWETLCNIAVGTAKGLSYLHEDCQPRILHYDIKPANVLLDSKFSPKVGDLGLAKLLGEDKTHITESRTRGTPIYWAPEIVMPYSSVTDKCDVYSFGVTLFDIIRRRRQLWGKDQNWFPFQVWKKFQTEKQEEIMEECGILENHREQAKRILSIALLCVQFKPGDRPSMSHVVRLLEGTEEVKLPNPFYDLSSSNAVMEAIPSMGDAVKVFEGKEEPEFPDNPQNPGSSSRTQIQSSTFENISLEQCIMIRAKELNITWGDTPKHWIWPYDAQSRFPEVAQLLEVYWLDIRVTIDPGTLSPETTYAVYLVFKFAKKRLGLNLPAKVTVKFEGGEAGASGTRTVYLDHRGTKKLSAPPSIKQMSRDRGDGWMEVEMGEFDSDGPEYGEVEVSLVENTLDKLKTGLIVEGIELRPKM